MNKIDLLDIEFSKFSIIDDFGRVFFWKGRIFRAINNEKVEFTKLLFSSGLLPHLIAEGLFVDSKITDYQIDGYGMVVEHELANVVSYPFEWSFSMLKAAAELALKLNIISAKYGYQTKDIHPYNVLFFGVNPKFIDLGSFISVSGRFSSYLYTFDEFAKCYIFPLKIWMLGDAFSARCYMQRWKLMTPVKSYISYRLGGVAGRFKKLVSKVWISFYRLQKAVHVIESSKSDGNKRKNYKFIKFVLRFSVLFRWSNMDIMLNRSKKYSLPKTKSEWGNYHEQLYLEDGKPLPSGRLKKIFDIVNDLKPRTVTDIAGNQGVLSQVVAESPAIERVICIDYDDVAIEKGYLRIVNSNFLQTNKISFAVINPFYPEVNKFEVPPDSRFRSELVLALALTHHLLLTQGYSLAYIFEVIKSFTHKYVLIEFMPLGLYDSVSKQGNGVPKWYTEEWFRIEFERYFMIKSVIKLEPNRTLFVGCVI